MLSLTGNLTGELHGLTFRFEVREADIPQPRPVLEAQFQTQQIGAMGDNVFRMVRVPLVPVDEYLAACDRGETPPEVQRASIYLEWYSQNGRVVLELLDPKIEFEGKYKDLADPEPDPASSTDDTESPQITTIIRNQDGTFQVIGDNDDTSDAPDAAEDADPFLLFPANLDEQIRESAATEDLDALPAFDDAGLDDDVVWSETEPESGRSEVKPRDWSEVIPGIDPQTKALYEEWDEVIYGTRDEPLTWLFEEPLCLPRPNNLRDESHAWQVLSTLLAAMALRGVAFDMCPHYTAMRAYRLLIDELLPKAGVHPNLAATGFVKHYCSWEYCEECNAEFEDRHRTQQPEK
ncbi:MAG: hypothetical protein O2856_05660 [Planctomycetota bacterium]|nr:hypothetical protein [Planctomycetota bacterium]